MDDVFRCEGRHRFLGAPGPRGHRRVIQVDQPWRLGKFSANESVIQQIPPLQGPRRLPGFHKFYYGGILGAGNAEETGARAIARSFSDLSDQNLS